MATVRRGVVPRLPAFRMTPNSSLLRMRRSRPKRALPGTWTVAICSLGAARRGGRCLGPEALPSFGTTSLDHESSAARSHADEEAVGPSSAAIVRLERSLHCFWNPLRKVEPAMLSGIASIVKTSRFLRVVREGRRVMVAALAEQLSCLIPSLISGLSG
jgi:hypothetical protein